MHLLFLCVEKTNLKQVVYRYFLTKEKGSCFIASANTAQKNAKEKIHHQMKILSYIDLTEILS